MAWKWKKYAVIIIIFLNTYEDPIYMTQYIGLDCK